MLVPTSFFQKILAERGMKRFDKINIRSVKRKRYLRGLTEEERLAKNKKTSEAGKRYWSTVTPEQKEEFRKKCSKAIKAGWKKAPESRKKMSRLMHEKWKEPAFRKMKSCLMKETHQLGLIPYRKRSTELEETPRINDYAGSLTMSEMKSLNDGEA